MTHTPSLATVTAQQRFLLFARQHRIARRLAFFLALAIPASGIFTYLTITNSTGPFGPDPRTVLTLAVTNLVLLFALLAIVARRALHLWLGLKRGSAGSRLQMRILTMFSLLSIVPTAIVAIFSAMLFNYGIQSWFNERVSTALDESVAVARAYLDEHKEVIRADALAMASDLNRESRSVFGTPGFFNQMVSAQAALRSLTEAIVFQRNHIIARTKLTFSLAFERIAQDAVERADRGEVVILEAEDDKIRALVKLDTGPDMYLLVGRLIDGKVAAHVDSAHGAVNEYKRLQSQISSLQVDFSIVFILVALILLLAAVWYGMVFAARLMAPISKLVSAAERVRAGDFSTKVDTGPENDEIGTLGRAFNRMTGQLEKQRHELIEANRQLDERRRFTEAVLVGVSAGVIALDKEKRIRLSNPSASQLLLLDPEESLQGRLFAELLPKMAELLAEAEKKPDKLIQDQITLTRGDRSHTLHVKITVETFGNEIEGFIVTFDDITPLVAAQRNAAWADVARRVAHEIKNPLTPITLAAERLKRKYLPQIQQEADSYVKYIDTISKHVGDIGKMVEEFVSFARMPAPEFRREKLGSLLRRAVFSEQVAHPDIQYELLVPEEELFLQCDERQISRLFTNLLKNAAESIESQEHGSPGLIIVTAYTGEERHIVQIKDNGPGFPPDQMHRIMEPYVTTRSKGTGLGLAIVKKTMEEHKGGVMIENNLEGGACVTLSFSADSDINVTP